MRGGLSPSLAARNAFERRLSATVASKRSKKCNQQDRGAVRLALFFKVHATGIWRRIRWRGEMRCAGGASGRCARREPAVAGTGNRVRLPLAWCTSTFPVEFAPRSAPVPDQHADPRSRLRRAVQPDALFTRTSKMIPTGTRKAAAAHLPTCLQRRPCRRIMKHGQP